LSRTRKALAFIDRSKRVLEVGPAFSPIAPKAAGWNTFVVDRMSQDELRAEYSHGGLPVQDIEPVDLVWRDESLDAAVPQSLHGTFDACIASHALEHIPDPIGLLLSFDKLLSDRGVVSLILPDKRFCADFFRPLTNSGAWIEAHDRRASRHSPRTLFEYHAYGVRSRGRFSWGQERPTDMAPFTTLQDASTTSEAAAKGPYVDAHAWCLTPASFQLLILELGALRKIPFAVRKVFPTLGCEFFVTLDRSVPDLKHADLERQRQVLMIATVRELAAQAKYLDNTAVDDFLGTLRLAMDRATDIPFWRRTVRKVFSSARAMKPS
jgi:SAM-dependent methyltransferase